MPPTRRSPRQHSSTPGADGEARKSDVDDVTESTTTAAAGTVREPHARIHSPKSGDQKLPDRDPAGKFFRDFAVGSWDVEMYLSANAGVIRDEERGFERLISSWVSGLERLSKAAESIRQKTKATDLLHQYKDGRQRDVIQKVRKRICEEEPPMVVSGSNNSIVFGNSGFVASHSSVSTNVIPRKRKNDAGTGKGSKSKKAKRPAAAPSFLKHFEQTYKTMDNGSKIVLPSGKFAEDIIYARYRREHTEMVAHSWIIDTSDEQVKGLFGKDDWKALCSRISGLRPLSTESKAFLSSFSQMSVASLQHYLDTTCTIDEGETLSPNILSERRWIRSVLAVWLRLCASSNFAKNHREFWYVANIWTPLFDCCMADASGGYMSRGESSAMATCARKSSLPNSSGRRRQIGHLYDGVLSFFDNELGTAEHSRSWNGEYNIKWKHDRLKVGKVLHDMLREMASKGKKMPVVGLVTAAWNCELVRVEYLAGYLCAFVSDSVTRIPSPEKGVQDLLVLCGRLLGYKDLLTKAMEDDFESLLSGTSEISREPVLIPRSIETDGSDQDGLGESLDLADVDEADHVSEAAP